MCQRVVLLESVTRNSVVTDKPRDTLCKRNGVADLKHAPTHTSYHAEFGRSALKDLGINIEPQNWRALELRSFWMEGVADLKIHAPPRHMSPRQIQQFWDKGRNGHKNDDPCETRSNKLPECCSEF